MDLDLQSYARNLFLRVFLSFFYVCFNIFTSTCRTTLIFFLTDNVEFGDCFQYVKHISPMIFRWARWFWSKSFAKNEAKSKIWAPSKSDSDLNFKVLFYVSFNIFTSKPSSSAKNHRRAMFYIFKTLSEPSAICQ